MTKVKIQNYDENKETNVSRTGYVQVDFMPGDSDWLKTYYHSPNEKDSQYKGVYRNLMIASIDGEGAKIVNDANCGVTSPAEDSLKLSEAIKELMALDKSSLNELGNNGRAYYEKEFDRNNLLEKLESIFKS